MADTDQVLKLAAIIRKVDGNHSKGAAALAESILDHPNFRDVLARWGNPAPPPAAGEVAELVEWLREQLHVCLQAPWTPGIKHFGRAAELLERLSPPQPVPVSERLPGPEDCDAEHYCWRWNTIGGLWARQPLTRSWYEFEGHWLPAHALPLPGVDE